MCVCVCVRVRARVCMSAHLVRSFCSQVTGCAVSEYVKCLLFIQGPFTIVDIYLFMQNIKMPAY